MNGSSFRKGIVWVLCCSLALFVLSSCREESILQENEDIAVLDVVQEKLDIDKTNLSVSDAIIVAKLSKSKLTRSFSDKAVQDVVTIYDEEDEPAIYAVNFEDGYMLISATRNYYPVLAVVDQGHYEHDSQQGAFHMIVNDLIESVKAAKDGNVKQSYGCLWSKYIECESPVTLQRKSRSEEDEYWAVFNDWYADVSSKNSAIVRKLTNCKNILPDNVYQNFVRQASDEDLWEGTQYSWQNTAYVVEETIENMNTIGPLLTTKWNQDRSFNTTQYEFLGCVTVAVGQLMRYYQKPNTIQWNDMPDTYGNKTLTDFLATLRVQLNVSEEGASNINNAESVLKSYGYSIDKIDHNATRIYSSLKQKRPVYARGEDEIGGKGHAWVIDGVYQSETIIRYTLYRLSDAWYPQFKYVTADGGVSEQYSDVVTYHMNWGWGGSCDGWFLDQRPWIVENGSYKYKFSKNRKELIFK